MRRRYDLPPIGRVRYVVAALASGTGYVVYDRRMGRIADGRYLTRADAQWAADQRNRGWRTDEGCASHADTSASAYATEATDCGGLVG